MCAPNTLARLVGLPAEAAGDATPPAEGPTSPGAPPPASSAPARDPYADTNPAALLPTGVPVVMLTGVYDGITYPAVALHYAQTARKSGDRATIELAPNAGHFEVINPTTPAFAQALAAVERLAK
jgi:pimeloyl-ACP methyl ester carboxylesterase